jgi:type IV secretory pathway component VirB8
MRYAPQKCTHPSQTMKMRRLRRSQRVLVVTAVVWEVLAVVAVGMVEMA